MAKKHVKLELTFIVDFKSPVTDDEITDIMSKVNIDVKHDLVSNILLKKLA
jgi:hypothetical protein